MKNSSPQSITILGSTGSIGESTIKLMELHPEKFKIIALTAHNNVKKLAENALKMRCKRAVIADESLYSELKTALSGTQIEVAAGAEAVIEAADMQSDTVMSAIVGAAGLLPTMAAIKRGAKIALANKECLVCAGELVMSAVKQYNATMIPVDSEHSAIFQVFDFKQPHTVDKIRITASGGPFRTFTNAQLHNVTLEQALKHPIWSMGSKISIDSATLMNKGLEVIEAWHLFPVKKEQIEVIIHPESIIHSMVEYVDGSVLAQLGTPNMSTPIAFALSYPDRITSNSAKLNLVETGKLTFHAPDYTKFAGLALSRSALDTGGSAPAILNAANEIAVGRFLNKEIRFADITRIIAQTLERIPATALQNLENVLDIDKQARITAREIVCMN